MAERPLPALVVEMDPFFAVLVRRALEAAGIDTRVAYSARAAALLTRSEQFSIAFVGVRLPDDTGLSLIEPIRLSQNTEIPIIVVGTDDAPSFEREVLAAGATAYLLKPVSVAQLREATAKWIG